MGNSVPLPSVWRMSSSSHLRSRKGITDGKGFSVAGHSHHWILVANKAQVTVAGPGIGAGGGNRILRQAGLRADCLVSLNGETVSRRKKEKGKREVNT